jgi:hypothetical protein
MLWSKILSNICAGLDILCPSRPEYHEIPVKNARAESLNHRAYRSEDGEFIFLLGWYNTCENISFVEHDL